MFEKYSNIKFAKNPTTAALQTDEETWWS